MNKQISVISMITMFSIFFSCRDNKERLPVSNFESVDYSYDNGWNEVFLVRVYNDGRLLYVKEEAGLIECFSYHLGQDNLMQLDSILYLLSKGSFDTAYFDQGHDKGIFKIDLVTKDKHSQCLVYGESAPEELMKANDYFQSLKESDSIWHKVDTVIPFRSLNGLGPKRFSQ